MTLADLQEAFRGLPPFGPPLPWEKRLLELIMQSDSGIVPLEVVKAVIDRPDRVKRILPYLTDDDIYDVRALAATIQPAGDDMRYVRDILNAWATRQTVSKMLKERASK
jgi:hypothetical protein